MLTLEEVNSIPIFDTLSHPTINGNWLHPRYDGMAVASDMLVQMEQSNICGTFAVGMKGIGGYDEERYVKSFRGNKFLPVAFLDFEGLEERHIKTRLQEVKSKGYVGVKLHPRFAHFYLTDSRLQKIIDCANELNLIPLLCTFFYSNQQSQNKNNIETLGDLLMAIDKESDIILLHGGLTRLLETMEMVRFFPNVILDLSLTLSKYEGTHLDSDFDYIFRLFDRRTTIGTDYPEISYAKLRERYNHFAQNTTKEKAENIAYKNIKNLLQKHLISIA